MSKSKLIKSAVAAALKPAALPGLDAPFSMNDVTQVMNLAASAPLPGGLGQAQAVSILLQRFQKWAAAQFLATATTKPAGKKAA